MDVQDKNPCINESGLKWDLVEEPDGGIGFPNTRLMHDAPLISSYYHMLKVKNSETITCIEVDGNNKFNFFFNTSQHSNMGIFFHAESDLFGCYFLSLHARVPC